MMISRQPSNPKPNLAEKYACAALILPQQFSNSVHQRILQCSHAIIVLIPLFGPFNLWPPTLQRHTLAVLHIHIIPRTGCSLPVAFSYSQTTAPMRGIGMHGLPIPDFRVFDDISTPAALSPVYHTYRYLGWILSRRPPFSAYTLGGCTDPRHLKKLKLVSSGTNRQDGYVLSQENIVDS